MYCNYNENGKTLFINHNYNILKHNNGNHFYLWFPYLPQIVQYNLFISKISLYFIHNYVFKRSNKYGIFVFDGK